MLSWSIFFLITAVVTALLGFSSMAGTAAGIAEILFRVFLVLFVISLFSRTANRMRPVNVRVALLVFWGKALRKSQRATRTT